MIAMIPFPSQPRLKTTLSLPGAHAFVAPPLHIAGFNEDRVYFTLLGVQG